MARRGASSQRLTVPGTNGNPPPSTIAAQIVNNASHIHGQEEPRTKIPFPELLQEFLRSPIIDDLDPDLNVQFISTIVEAGLDALHHSNPFALDQPKNLAIDSIRAIKISIWQIPQLLFSSRTAESESGPDPPVFLWLFPKLLGLLGPQRFDTLQVHLQDLLTTCLAAVGRKPDLWQYGAAISDLYRSTVDGILAALDAPEEPAQVFQARCKVVIPPLSSVGELWPESRSLVALPRGCQITITTRQQALLAGLYLIQGLLGLPKDQQSGGDTGTLQHADKYLLWSLDRSTAFWRKFLLPNGHMDKGPQDEAVCAKYMQLLELTAFSTIDRAPDGPHILKAAIMLSSGLSDLIQRCSSTPLSAPNQVLLALLLVKLRGLLHGLSDRGGSPSAASRHLKNTITDNMAPVLLDTCLNAEKLASLHRDLQLAMCLWTSTGNWSAEVNALRDALGSNGVNSFEHVILREAAATAVKAFSEATFVHTERPSKRRRTAQYDVVNAAQSLYNEIATIVTGGQNDSAALSADSILKTYDARAQGAANGDAEHPDQQTEGVEGGVCELILAIGKLACVGSHALQRVDSSSTDWQLSNCCVCDANSASTFARKGYWDQGRGTEDWKEAIAALLQIVQRPDFRDSGRPRIFMALTIRRVFNHISQTPYLDLEESSLGEWLLASMSRSLRELRLSAVQAILAFLHDDVPQPVRGKNRMFVLEFFHTLSKKDTLAVHETLIMAYGQVARVCGEDELPIILLQLVEYLGHTNALICGMAFNELASIADFFDKKPADLFRPYWRSIGVTVCKDLRNKPQKAQLLSDLTEQTVTQLLLSTQAEILPHLVLSKRQDILEQIATARKSSIEGICMQPNKHLANILALLLCQPVADVEQNTMDALVVASPAFGERGYDLSDYVKYEPVAIACEILKSAADQHDSKKNQYYRGFQILAALAEVRQSQKKTPSKTSKKKSLQTFFDLHLLGIMAHFSEILDSVVNHPFVEKKRCVGAINEMITIAGSNVSSALPQIRACLQSAMADPQLCDQTFLVWSALLDVLDEEDLELVVDQTFALIAQNWDSFSEDTHIKADETLKALVQKHNRLLMERISYLPSLASIPMLSKLERELSRLKEKENKVTLINTFSHRLKDENAVVVRHALKELIPFLEEHQKILHQAAMSDKPFPSLPSLTRSLLDASVRFSEDGDDIPILCARCLGLVGGLDPYRVEAVREKSHILVLSNFERLDEVIDFCAFLLEDVLVKVFHSTTNARAQGFLAYVMQELLRACGFTSLTVQRPRASQPSPALARWTEIPETVRNTLTPFLSSRYLIKGVPQSVAQQYPIFGPGISHSAWLRAFVYDLLRKGNGENARMIFTALARLIKGHDLSISTFILPFAVLNVIITGADNDTSQIGQELLTVLQTEIPPGDQVEAAKIKQCSENVFQTLDYLALWLQEKRKAVSDARSQAGRTGRGISEMEEIKDIAAISCMEGILQQIPAEVISRRAVECGSYARALYHWEQYYRQEQAKAENAGVPFHRDELMEHLQFIYSNIEEPDCIEGISTNLQVLNPDQQIIEHRKAGRWTAAQSWYELSLLERPDDTETQINLLTALKQSGQYDSILNHVDGFRASDTYSPTTLPFAVEAAWSTGKWSHLERLLASASSEESSRTLDFNIGVGGALLALRKKQYDVFQGTIESLRAAVAKKLSPTSTASLQACHDELIKLHVLYELESLSGLAASLLTDRAAIVENMDRRLDVLGAYTADKQYLLGVRRAVMEVSRINFTKLDIAAAWLTTARLARKADFMSTAFSAVMHAAKLGDDASKIEYSKLLWKEGHHRKAIQNLEGAIKSNAFQSRDAVPIEISVNTNMDQGGTPNKVKCHAELLLAKWLDRAGQTTAIVLKDSYASGIMSYPRWDKGHYYLGRHYNKLFESEKTLPASKQTKTFAAGEYNKLVIENYIRSVVYGTKYYYQTIPKILTLWLDLGMEVASSGSQKQGVHKEWFDHKVNYLDAINRHIKRYTNERMPAYAWYTAYPQIITRIAHPHEGVWEVLQQIIVKVAGQYPQQALWSILPVTKATERHRQQRGLQVLSKLKGEPTKRRNHTLDLKQLIAHSQRLTDALLAACDAPVEPRVTRVSLSKTLGFNVKLAPCALVVPIEATMVASLPSTIDSKVIRGHNPFPLDAVTIAGFMDDVLVLSSLQRPRKLTVRGSDGRAYGLLCKPKDDLRKDQRLMEFNAMINRALHRDIESSKRRLYIKTYGVTPLNEECGIIEWVEGLKPMRDILLNSYKQKGVRLNYNDLRLLLAEACSDPSKIGIFTNTISKQFFPVLYQWFIESFPEPDAWFAARLRYTRSCAAMSIVGHVLGLGDRHGENVLLEEGNGGTFHVDFNCLFDKGLTFEKPELVPFRLTHNMVDAMGPQGIEGPFRKAAELTYTQLRQHEDTLITILETFVHDPTADFLGGKKRKRSTPGVPETPQEVLESVRMKVHGVLKGETVPLSVEGYVEELIRMARDPMNLASMYIGWCAFL